MAQITASPPQSLPSSPSFSASRSTSSSKPTLSLDLSNLPALSQPTPPSNTLLITDLQDLYLFQPSSLSSIRSQITSVAPLNSFSPLPSLRRIVCSFHSVDDAIRIRQMLDGQALLGRNVRARIYFGEPTPILDEEEARRPKLLEAPQLDKLFFISPPPSPPHGWVMRNEDPPNKEVHADDLAQALARLKTGGDGEGESAFFSSSSEVVEPGTPASLVFASEKNYRRPQQQQQRSRSSTIIYNPEDHGGSPGLPAVMVEDTSLPPEFDGEGMEMSPIEMSVKRTTTLPPRTSRPPVELME